MVELAGTGTFNLGALASAARALGRGALTVGLVAVTGCADGGGGDGCHGAVELQIANNSSIAHDVNYDASGCKGDGSLPAGPGGYADWLKADLSLSEGETVRVTVDPAGSSADVTCTVAAGVGSGGIDYVRVSVDASGIPVCDCGTDEYAGPACT